MAKKIIERSYRTLVGTLGPETRIGQGTYIYDTNDSIRDFAMFAVFTGMSTTAEQFSIQFLADRMEPYLDYTRTADFSRPVAILRDVLTELYIKLESEGYVEPNTAYHGFSVVLAAGDTVWIARANGCPVFYLKDRKFKAIYTQPKTRGRDSLQIEAVKIDDGDRIMLSSETIIKHPTKLELRNVLLAGDDLNLACSKIHMLATRYEELESPRLMLILFRRNEEKTQTLFTKRNAIVVGLVAIFIMLLFLWGDIVRLVESSRIGYIVKKPSAITEVVKSIGQNAKSYTPELVFERLAVAYDIAPAADGTIYIIDDKESKIVHYDPASQRSELIGDKADFTFPTGIEIEGNRLFVADFSSVVSNVFVFGTDGSYIGKIPNERSGNISLRNPKALAEQGGGIYVCDRGNNRVIEFDGNGIEKRTINLPSDYNEPNGIAVTDDGNIFITLKRTGSVAKIVGKRVEPFTVFEEDQQGNSGKVELNKPSGIAVDRQGFVYIADTGNQRVLITNPMGRVMSIIDSQTLADLDSFYPMSVKLDPDKSYLYIVAANHYSYSPECEGKCQSKIWRVKI